MVLVVVFGLAAAGKLADRAGGRRALVDLGIPERFTAAGAVLLPLAELAVAAALLVRPWARLGAAGALALLVLFSLVVALNLAAGRQTDCHCFGRLLSSRIGAATLVRNGMLALLSALLLGRPAGGWALVGLAAVAGAVLLVAVRRRRVGLSIPGAASGTPSISRRRALGLAAMTIAAAALGFRPQATACGAECRSSADCPDTCPNCRKQPGYLQGHCH
jgi:hypothetical protein